MAAAAASAAAGERTGAAHDVQAAAMCVRARAQRGAPHRAACAAAATSGNGPVRRWQPRGRGAARTSPHACAWLLAASLLALCATAQELDLTFAYSTLDQDYLPITPRPRPGVAHDYDYIPYTYALPHYGIPASVPTLEARCLDARNACPLNVTGGVELSLLPHPLSGIYEPVSCFTAHTTYTRRISDADAARGWAGPAQYVLYFSQALDDATALTPAWYFARLYVAFSFEYLARLRVGPAGYARARQPAWGAAAAAGPWDVCATYIPGANASGDPGRCTSFRTGNTADANRWRASPSLSVQCVDGWLAGADAITPTGEACNGAGTACALVVNASGALAGRFELVGCQSLRPLYRRSADGAAIYWDTDAGAWLACASGSACGVAGALAALVNIPAPGTPAGGPAFNFSGAAHAVAVPMRPDAVPPGWDWAVPTPPGSAPTLTLAPGAGTPRGFSLNASSVSVACAANGTAPAAAPPPPPPPPVARVVRATLQLDGAFTVKSFRTPQRAALCNVFAEALGLPPGVTTVTGVANISQSSSGTAARRLLVDAPNATQLCGVDVAMLLIAASPLDAVAVAERLASLLGGGQASPLAAAVEVILPAVSGITLLSIVPALPVPREAASVVVLAACVGTLLPVALLTVVLALLLRRRDTSRRRKAAAETRDVILSMEVAFAQSVDSGSLPGGAPALLPFDHWRALTSSASAATGTTFSFAPLSGVAAPAGNTSSSGSAERAPVAPLQFGAEDVVLVARLGAGRFSVAYAASWRGTAVCVKAWHQTSGGGALPDASALRAQMARLSRLRHPNIASVYGHCLASPPLLLLELGSRGSLASLLRAPDAAALPWRERCRLALGVACGLAYIHAQEPVLPHLDVKCENVVLDDGLTPKLADFGLALFHAVPNGTGATAADASMRDAARLCGTPLHAAPELSEAATSAPLTRPLTLDVYSFGSAILHPLAHRHFEEFKTPLYRHVYSAQEGSGDGAAAFTGQWSPVQILVARCMLQWQPEVCEACPPPLAEAIRRCCMVDPAARPCMAELRDELATLLEASAEW